MRGLIRFFGYGPQDKGEEDLGRLIRLWLLPRLGSSLQPRESGPARLRAEEENGLKKRDFYLNKC